MRCPNCGTQNPNGVKFCTQCGKAIGSMMNIVLIYALIGAGIALVTGPIPGSSIILSALEIYMVYDLAKRYKCSLNLSEIGCVTLGILVLALLLKLGVSTLLEFTPILGWLIGKPAVAFLAILLLGALSDRYFRDRQRLSSR